MYCGICVALSAFCAYRRKPLCQSLCILLPQRVGYGGVVFHAVGIILSTLYIPWINKLFSLRFFRYLGSLSMEIYLFHFIVQCAIRNIDIYWGLGLNYSARKVWVVYVLATLLVSVIYKHLFAKLNTKFFDKVRNILIKEPFSVSS